MIQLVLHSVAVWWVRQANVTGAKHLRTIVYSIYNFKKEITLKFKKINVVIRRKFGTHHKIPPQHSSIVLTAVATTCISRASE
jgi:hypothetical protein